MNYHYEQRALRRFKYALIRHSLAFMRGLGWTIIGMCGATFIFLVIDVMMR